MGVFHPLPFTARPVPEFSIIVNSKNAYAPSVINCRNLFQFDFHLIITTYLCIWASFFNLIPVVFVVILFILSMWLLIRFIVRCGAYGYGLLTKVFSTATLYFSNRFKLIVKSSLRDATINSIYFVVLFRPNFMLASEEYPMKTHKNQRLLATLSPRDIPCGATNQGTCLVACSFFSEVF